MKMENEPNRLSNDEIDKLPSIDKYMMATTAIHLLGDLSRNNGALCRVTKESKTDYYGMWITGYGYFNVRFPKETTRELTEDEIEKFNNMHIQHSSGFSHKLKVD